MPGLAQKNEYNSSGFWSKEVDGVSYNQLQKFWSELSSKARQELLRIDKQALFEQARKNMCCSRCNGLLFEGFLQIVTYGRSLQQKKSIGNLPCNSSGASKDQFDCNSVVSNICTDEMQDPAVDQCGGLTTTRDGSLTLLDCYLYAKSFKGLQTVFDCARARERERELIYPDACGGGGRVWISQGIMAGYGKGHGTREACALHTTRLSCDTLVDFWSALEEESRQSLLGMKEEDFMERLTYRFECKKFCRDCRRNVIREFKELKELKRMQREPRCTDWFCVADTAFQYEVDIDSVQADWSQSFTENCGYHQFEWAIGTEEGESDILEFEYVGNDGNAQVNGLDLRGLHECYITLRAFKLNGHSSEISVKADALKGQQCVHSRLVVGGGFVSIKSGECIRMFFEHAEEAEEDEDEVLIDKDGNEIDDECLRPQKHAKSPELAREFLLDAAMVISKEQVEKAFREGNARQNAHSMFVCLSSKLLEQRVHIACKEIATLEKQNKLLAEEEKEKREEDERKERKRTKEKEKKLRRKERLKDKERGKELKNPKCCDQSILSNSTTQEEGSLNLIKETNNTVRCEESGTETGDVDLSPLRSPDAYGGECLDGCLSPRAGAHCCDSAARKNINHEDENGYLTNESPRPVHQTARFWKKLQPDQRRYPENASLDVSKPAYRTNRYVQASYKREYLPRNKVITGRSPCIWEPVSARKVLDSMDLKNARHSSNSEVLVTCSTNKAEEIEDARTAVKSHHTQSGYNGTEKLCTVNLSEISRDSGNFINSTEEEKTVKAHIKPTNNDLYSKDPMMSRNSSSDNCCSCFSEGDSNTAFSNNGNTGSSSMSDSDDASQQFERRENLVDAGNDIPDCHEKIQEIKKCVDERDAPSIENMSKLPADNGETILPEAPFMVPSHNKENVVSGVNTGSYFSQPQSMMFLPMLNQTMPLSVFQAPTSMGYYHQAPVSWSAAPVTGLMPFPLPNHYVYTCPVGYGQYGTPFHHSATPFCNSGPAPVFHPLANPNTLNIVDQAQTLETLDHSSLKEADEKKLSQISPMETPTSGGPDIDNDKNFSLFHFGGPVALPKGSKSNAAHFKDEVLEEFSLQFSGDHVLGDPNCNHKKQKESTVGEEYNLFATNNNLRFSIF